MAIISEKVMPYRCALYRKLAEFEDIYLDVIFLDRWGLEERYDPTMGARYSWGESVLQGFNYQFVENKSGVKVTYTGADKTEKEARLGTFGAIIYYFRTFFGLVNFGLPRLIRSGRYDVVIIENYSSISSLLGALYARLGGALVFLRGEAVRRRNQSRFLLMLKKIYLGVIFKIYDGFMYSCSANKSYYLYYGAKSEFLYFVPSAVDSSFFSPEQRTNFFSGRASLGIPQDDVVFLGVGRMVPRKNWSEAIEAFAIFLNSFPGGTLVLVGDGPERDDLSFKIGGKIEGKVIFAGFKNQNEILDYYEAADIVVQSSSYDPSPKVLNEALAFGLPMIVSDAVGTAGDVCIDKNNGIVYPAGDVKGLAEAMLNLAKNPDMRRQYSESSLRLRDEWSLQAGAENIVKAVKQRLG